MAYEPWPAYCFFGDHGIRATRDGNRRRVESALQGGNLGSLSATPDGLTLTVTAEDNPDGFILVSSNAQALGRSVFGNEGDDDSFDKTVVEVVSFANSSYVVLSGHAGFFNENSLPWEARDVTLAIVLEPASLALLGIGLAALLAE